MSVFFGGLCRFLNLSHYCIIYRPYSRLSMKETEDFFSLQLRKCALSRPVTRLYLCKMRCKCSHFNSLIYSWASQKRERGMQMSLSGFALGPGTATNKPVSLKELTALLPYLTICPALDSYLHFLCECWCHQLLLFQSHEDQTARCSADMCAILGVECQEFLLAIVVYFVTYICIFRIFPPSVRPVRLQDLSRLRTEVMKCVSERSVLSPFTHSLLSLLSCVVCSSREVCGGSAAEL